MGKPQTVGSHIKPTYPNPATAMNPLSQLDRLALVSRVLLDQRVLDLRKENEELRLALFWKDYSIKKLQKAMTKANAAQTGPRCGCTSCYHSGRDNFWKVEYDKDMECKFKPWFEHLVQECEMVIGKKQDTNREINAHSTRDCLYPPDCHIANLGRGNWVFCSYGSWICNATRAEDPALLKLKLLFDKLKSHSDDK